MRPVSGSELPRKLLNGSKMRLSFMRDEDQETSQARRGKEVILPETQIDPKRLKQAFEWPGKTRDIPESLAIAAAIWLAQVNSFRDVEEELIEAQGSLGDQRQGHRAAISVLIGDGEKLVFVIKGEGI